MTGTVIDHTEKRTLQRRERASADRIFNDLKGRYPNRIFRGTEYTMPWLLKRLRTGITRLDIALGGGFPAGGMSMLYGREGVGKNYIANLVIAQQQKLYGDDFRAMVISTEMPFDKQFAQLCGVKIGLSQMEIHSLDVTIEKVSGSPLTEEQVQELQAEVGTFVLVPPDTAETAFDIALDAIASREFDIVLIDSFGALLTEHEEDALLNESSRVGGPAGLNTRFTRKLFPLLSPDGNGDPNLTCVLGLNQIRDNMKQATPYSPATREGGGWALKHARWVGVELKRVGAVKKGERTIGKTVQYEVTKQKAGGHEGHVGNYDFIWGSDPIGIVREQEVLLAGAEYGVISKSGSWFNYGDTRLGQGIDKAAKALLDLGLIDEVEAGCYAAANVRCNWDVRPLYADPK
jgi:recombination protein RecA